MANSKLDLEQVQMLFIAHALGGLLARDRHRNTSEPEDVAQAAYEFGTLAAIRLVQREDFEAVDEEQPISVDALLRMCDRIDKMSEKELEQVAIRVRTRADLLAKQKG